MRSAFCPVIRGRRSGTTLPGSADALRLGNRLATDDCLADGQLGFKEWLLRGGLYEALYERDYGRAPGSDPSAAPPIDYVAWGAEAAPEHVAVRRFADCVVRANPQAARGLILSRVGDDTEHTAFAALAPALSGCLGQGEQVAFSRPILRGVVAETLYRLSQAAGSQGQGGA